MQADRQLMAGFMLSEVLLWPWRQDAFLYIQRQGFFPFSRGLSNHQWSALSALTRLPLSGLFAGCCSIRLPPAC